MSEETASGLTIAAGTPGGSFEPFANAVAGILMEQHPNGEVSIEPSPGSVENTRRVHDNPNYLGLAFAAETYLGYNGMEIFAEEGAKTNVRVVTLLYIAYAQLAVTADRRDSGIRRPGWQERGDWRPRFRHGTDIRTPRDSGWHLGTDYAGLQRWNRRRDGSPK